MLVLEWTDPPFVAGHWVPDLVTAAGGVPVLARRRGALGAGDLGRRPRRRPRGRRRPRRARAATAWRDAVAQAHAVVDVLGDGLSAGCAVHAVDAGGCVTRPGPRVVDAVEALAAAWHPAVASAAGVTPRPGVVAAVRPA